MKKVLLLTLLLGLFATQVTLGQQKIAGSAHDFSLETWVTDNQICLPCHTPHDADTAVSDSPLWNHEISAATYVVYSSPTMDATVGQPAGTSKLCLSCHDGTIAIDSYGGATGTTFLVNGTDPGYVGTALNDDHPISFDYNTALSVTDPGLRDPSGSYTTFLGGSIQDDLLGGGSTMECSSCHDVHNNITTGNTYLLRIDVASSVLCLTCHDK